MSSAVKPSHYSKVIVFKIDLVYIILLLPVRIFLLCLQSPWIHEHLQYVLFTYRPCERTFDSCSRESRLHESTSRLQCWVRR